MQLTKFTHSCVRLVDGERALVIDPGSFCEVEEALDGVSTVLITHEHADHIDVLRLTAAAQADPDLRVWAPQSVAALLGDLGDRVTVVAPDQTFTAGGFSIATLGGQHALIHPQIPVVHNVGYVVEGNVYHPGDSLVVPKQPVGTLLVPAHAPWSKIGEVIDFQIAVRAAKAFAIHDGLLNDNGLGLIQAQLGRFGAEYGTEFSRLTPIATVDV